MKIIPKIVLIALVVLFTGIHSFAQAPQGITYQAVARDGSGNPLANKPIGVRITIKDGSSSGTTVYQETESGVVTNQFGLFTVQLGMGTAVSGTFSAINWGVNSKYIQVEFDPAGGTSYLDMGTTQLLSVPYALYSAKAGNAKDSLIINGNQLSIVGGNSVLLPSGSGGGDNWGTQTVVSNSTLTGTGTFASPLGLAQQGATNGQVLKWNGVSWAPSADNNTDDQTLSINGSSLSISNGNSITLPTGADNWGSQTAATNATLTGNGTSGSPLGLAQQGASNGQVLKWNGSAWLPGADNNTDAQQLSISGNTLLLTNGGSVTLPVSSGADNWGTQTAATNASLSGNGTSGSPLSIAQQGASTGQVLKWNGAAWLPSTDNDAQTLTVNGNSLTISGGNTVTLPSSSGGDNWGTQTAVTNSTLDGNGTAGSPLGLSSQGALNGQVLKWNGTTWAPAADNNTDAQTLSINGNSLTIAGGNTVTLPSGADNWGTQTAATDVTLSGNGTVASPLSISSQGASSGQVLKWNGASWAPAADNNTDAQTLSINGSNLTISGGNTIALPAGADNWGSQTAATTPRLSGNGTAGSPLDIASQGASSGEVLKWNGSTWAPAADNNSDAQTLSINGSSLTISNGNTIIIPSGADNWGSQVAITDATLKGNGSAAGAQSLGIAQQGAATGQTLKWNGSTWLPANDNDAQQLSLSGNTLSLTNGGSVNLPTSGGGGSLNIVSSSLATDLTLDAPSFTSLPGVTVNFTPTASNVFIEFTASGFGFTDGISIIEFQVLVNGTPVGGMGEKVGTIQWDDLLFFDYYTTPWGAAFTKMVAVNPGVSNTITVQYRTSTAYGSSAAAINAATQPAQHATVTVFNQ